MLGAVVSDGRSSRGAAAVPPTWPHRARRPWRCPGLGCLFGPEHYGDPNLMDQNHTWPVGLRTAAQTRPSAPHVSGAGAGEQNIL